MRPYIPYLLGTTLAAVLGACALQTQADPSPAGNAMPAASAGANATVDAKMEDDAEALFATLTPAERTKAVLPASDAQRLEMIFPGGPRAGIQIQTLDAHQRTLANALIDDFLSPSGRALADKIIAQAGPEGLGRYYLAFFGTPTRGSVHSWRIAEHHLTLVDVEVDADAHMSVGPILLGSNPPDFFEAQEDALIALYGSLTPSELAGAAAPDKGISSAPIGAAGIAVSQLSPATQTRLSDILTQRLALFSEPMQTRLRTLLERAGGISSLRMAFYGPALKRCKQGGIWDWKLAGPSFLLDYENSRGHIHTTVLAGPPASTHL